MLHEDHPDVVLLHIDSNDINNQTNDKIKTEKLTEDVINNIGFRESDNMPLQKFQSNDKLS